jgi:uncharacterized SAM-binding protein YcdF (DUF218 family)
MFLFLSKLLPLFFYPLGLSCVCLAIAVLTFWRRPRFAAGAVALALSVLLLASNTFLARGVVRSLERRFLPATVMPKAEAIVVLGGCTQSRLSPRPWVEVVESGDRLLYGAKLYREGQAPWLILAGGRVDWRHPGQAESVDMAELIQTMGVPSSAILQDPWSLNTRENAVNVKKILETHQLRGPVLLVTSAMHMPRAIAIFRQLKIDAIAAPTDFLVADLGQRPSIMASLLEMVPNVEALEMTTQACKEYLGLCIYRLRGWL